MLWQPGLREPVLQKPRNAGIGNSIKIRYLQTISHIAYMYINARYSFNAQW